MPENPATAVDPAPAPSGEAQSPSSSAAAGVPTAADSGMHSMDFRAATPLDIGAQRQLRLRHEELARSLSTRLSIYLRFECQVVLVNVEPVRCRAWLNRLVSPTHITLFSLDSMPGRGVLEISPKLGLIMVDRLLGGTGEPENVTRDLTEIEVAIADEVIQILLREWCQYLPMPEPIRLTLAGHENNSKFVRAAADEAPLLAVTLQLTIKGQTELVRIGVPFAMLESVLSQLIVPPQASERPAPPPQPPVTWNPQLDQVRIPLTARCQEFEVSARRLAGLQVGDVLPIEPSYLNRVQVRLARVPKFVGRLGRQGSNRAVELTAIIPK